MDRSVKFRKGREKLLLFPDHGMDLVSMMPESGASRLRIECPYLRSLE